MELLIAAGIATIGYRMSAATSSSNSLASSLAPSNSRTSNLSNSSNSSEQQPIVTVAEARATERLAAETISRAAERPLETGVISQPQLQPYFRSAKTQNTNDSVKSRIHDLFTGSVMFDSSSTGTYRKKMESAPRFEPMPQPVTSSGSSGNPVCWDRQLPQPSLLQNNVVPTEQIRVGPGIAVGPDVPSSDGFHPMTRVMPQNVNEHRINELGVQINIGSAPNAMRTADPKLSANRPPRVWNYDRRPPEATKAAVNARTHRSDGLRCADRVHGGEYFGGATARGPQVGSDASRHTRARSDANSGLPQTNVTAARHGTGGFATTAFDMHRIDSTQREARTDFFGGAGHMVPTGTTHVSDRTRTTLRDVHGNGPVEHGPAISKDKGPMIQCTYRQLEKEAKRPVVEGYVPGVQRNVEYRRATIGDPDDWELSGMCKGKYMAIRKQAQENRTMSHGASSSMYLNMSEPGRSTTGQNKLPEVNPRQDFGMASAILAGNPLAVRPLAS